MRTRLFWLTTGCCSLFIGAVLYGIYRQDTYIGHFLGQWLPAYRPIRGTFSGLLAWYVPDFLWMFALSCMTFSVILPRGKAAIRWAFTLAVYGSLWEFAQWIRIVSGTADLWDVMLYITAVILAVLINFMKEG